MRIKFWIKFKFLRSEGTENSFLFITYTELIFQFDFLIKY